MNAEIARGFKEHNLLQVESPKNEEEKEVHSSKLRALILSSFDDINWLHYLIRHGQIKNEKLIRAYKNQIIRWYQLFKETLLHNFDNEGSYEELKSLYKDFINVRPPNINDQKHPCIF